MCPVTIKETCQDKPKTVSYIVNDPNYFTDYILLQIVNQVGEETCDLEEHQFCQPIWQLIPHFEDEEFCTESQQEVCQARKVNPHEVVKPKPIKVCTKTSLE